MDIKSHKATVGDVLKKNDIVDLVLYENRVLLKQKPAFKQCLFGSSYFCSWP